MFSRRSVFVLGGTLFLATGLLLSGCSLELGDEAPPNDRGDLELSCLGKIRTDVLDFIDGESSPEKVSDTMGCLRGALQEFNFYGGAGRSGPLNGFKPVDLKRFLNRKFLGDTKISDAFLRELIEVKVVMVGGQRDFVTKSEFQALIDLTKFIEEQARRTAPFMKLYRKMLGPEDLSRVNNAFVDEAKYELRSVAAAVANRLRLSRGEYNLDRLGGLIREARYFVHWERTNPKSPSVEELMTLMRVYIDFSVGEQKKNNNGSYLYPSDWIPFFITFAEWFGVYLDYQYKIKDSHWSHGSGLMALIKTIDEGLNHLVSAVNQQPDQKIGFPLVDRILIQALKYFDLPWDLRFEESLRPVIHYFIEKILRDPKVPLKEARSQGLTVANLQEFRNEFYLWAEGQKYLARVYRRADEEAGFDIGSFLSLGFNWGATEGEKEIDFLVDSNPPMFRPEDRRVWVIDPALRRDPNYSIVHNFEGLSHLNLIKVASRVLVRGWATEPDRAKNVIGLTRDESEDFYQVVREFGVDLNLMDPRGAEVGYRFFMESNLFTFSGNGLHNDDGKSDKHLMTLQESIQQLALIYSGALVRNRIYDDALIACSDIIQDDLKATGRPVPRKDSLFNQNMLPRECLVRFFVENVGAYLGNLPLMSGRAETNPEGFGRPYFESTLEVSRAPCFEPGWVELSELGSVTTLIHYVETVFTRHDLDGNGYMDGLEVMRAYPKFRDIMGVEIEKRFGMNDLSESRLKAAFAYIMAEGRIPENSFTDRGARTIASWASWWGYFNNDPSQSFESLEDVPAMRVDRLAVMRVLGLIVNQQKAGISCPSAKPF